MTELEERGAFSFAKFLSKHGLATRKEIIKSFYKFIHNENIRCCICNNYIAPKNVSIDHIIPQSKGGTNDLSNLQVTHDKCNSKKSNISMLKMYERETPV